MNREEVIKHAERLNGLDPKEFSVQSCESCILGHLKRAKGETGLCEPVAVKHLGIRQETAEYLFWPFGWLGPEVDTVEMTAKQAAGMLTILAFYGEEAFSRIAMEAQQQREKYLDSLD